MLDDRSIGHRRRRHHDAYVNAALDRLSKCLHRFVVRKHVWILSRLIQVRATPLLVHRRAAGRNRLALPVSEAMFDSAYMIN